MSANFDLFKMPELFSFSHPSCPLITKESIMRFAVSDSSQPQAAAPLAIETVPQDIGPLLKLSSCLEKHFVLLASIIVSVRSFT